MSVLPAAIKAVKPLKPKTFLPLRLTRRLDVKRTNEIISVMEGIVCERFVEYSDFE